MINLRTSYWVLYKQEGHTVFVYTIELETVNLILEQK